MARSRRQRCARRQGLCTSGTIVGCRGRSLPRPACRRLGACERHHSTDIQLLESSRIRATSFLSQNGNVKLFVSVPHQIDVICNSGEEQGRVEWEVRGEIEKHCDAKHNLNDGAESHADPDPEDRDEEFWLRAQQTWLRRAHTKCEESDDPDSEDEDSEDETEEEDDDEDSSVRQAMLEKLGPRQRRMSHACWVSRRVNDLCDEDAYEPDSEDEAIKSALMDAIAAASANVETDLCSGTALDVLACADGQQDADMPPWSQVHFAQRALTFLIKPETETTIALVSTTCNTRWALDRVVEMPLLDSPSSPLGKWLPDRTRRVARSKQE